MSSLVKYLFMKGYSEKNEIPLDSERKKEKVIYMYYNLYYSVIITTGGIY